MPDESKRHYKYQLLDPVDEPYATIQFYYRPSHILQKMGTMIPMESNMHLTPKSSAVSAPVNIATPPFHTGSQALRTSWHLFHHSVDRSSPSPDTPTNQADINHGDCHRDHTSSIASFDFGTLPSPTRDDLLGPGYQEEQGSYGAVDNISDTGKQCLGQLAGDQDHDSPVDTALDLQDSPNVHVWTSSRTTSAESLPLPYRKNPFSDAETSNRSSRDVNIRRPASYDHLATTPAARTVLLVNRSPGERVSGPSPPSLPKTNRSRPFSASPQKKQEKLLGIGVDGTDFDPKLEHPPETEHKRPRSPIKASSAMLRRLFSSTSTLPGISARSTEYSPSTGSEVGRELYSAASGHEMEAGQDDLLLTPTPPPRRTTQPRKNGSSGFMYKFLRKGAAPR